MAVWKHQIQEKYRFNSDSIILASKKMANYQASIEYLISRIAF